MQSVSPVARSSPRPTPSRGPGDGRAQMNQDEGNKPGAAKCPFWGQPSALLIHVGTEQGAGGSSSIKSTDLAHRLIPCSPRKAKVQQGDGRGYITAADVDSGLKTPFQLSPCYPRSCPSLHRLLATVPPSPLRHWHRSYPTAAQVPAVPPSLLGCIARSQSHFCFDVLPQSCRSGKGEKSQPRRGPSLCPALQPTREEWAPSFRAHWSLSRAAASSRQLQRACATSATSAAA